MISKKLSRLISLFEESEIKDASSGIEIIKTFELEPTDFKAFERFNHDKIESYGRSTVYESKRLSFMLMSWNSGDFTAIHNHENSSWGLVHLFGQAAHRLYEVSDDLLKPLQRETIESGQTIAVEEGLTHMMGNNTNECFTSLHIYVRERNNLQASASLLYFPENMKVYTTTGPAFLLRDKNAVYSSSFRVAEEELLQDYHELTSSFYIRNNLTSISA